MLVFKKIPKIAQLFAVVFISFVGFLSIAYAEQRVHVSADGKLIYYVQKDDKTYLSRLFISNNGGQSFSNAVEVPQFSLEAIYSMNKNNNIIYAGGFEGSAQINSDDKTFHSLASDDKNFASAYVMATYISPGDKKLYMGGDDSDGDNSWLFIGTRKDGGEEITWRDDFLYSCGKEGYGTLNINAITGQGNTVYVASDTFTNKSRGLCISKDAGTTWQMADSFPERHSSAIYAVQKEHGMLYASGYNYEQNEDTAKPELYISDDGAASWIKTNFGADNSYPFITSITGSFDGNIVYVAADDYGTALGGIWIKNTPAMNFKKIIFPDKKNYGVNSIASSADGKVVAARGCYPVSKYNKYCVVWTSTDAGQTWRSSVPQ